MKQAFSSIRDAIKDLKDRKMIIVVDDPSRENQGDCVFPAQTATLDKVKFIINECRGQLCVPISVQKAASLDLPLMVPTGKNTEKTKLLFTVSVDAKNVKSFGISASDKLKTIQALVNPRTKPSDLVRPGHVFPILETSGGLHKRKGHTEATLALCRLAGFEPVGVLAEILDDSGEPANRKHLVSFAQKHKLSLIIVSDLKTYLKTHPQEEHEYSTITKLSTATLPTRFGTFEISVFRSLQDGFEHIALTLGGVSKQPVLTRIHSQCITGDTFGSLRCDCKEQLEESMQRIASEGRGIILYLAQEGRDIGLSAKIAAYKLQEEGLDTVQANEALGHQKDARNYDVAAQILKSLGVRDITLLTNNPSKVNDLKLQGIKVITQSLEITPSAINRRYLETKKKKLGHLLTQV